MKNKIVRDKICYTTRPKRAEHSPRDGETSWLGKINDRFVQSYLDKLHVLPKIEGGGEGDDEVRGLLTSPSLQRATRSEQLKSSLTQPQGLFSPKPTGQFASKG